MKFAFKYFVESLSSITIKLNRLALLSGIFSSLPAICINLQKKAAVSFKCNIVSFNFVVDRITVAVFAIKTFDQSHSPLPKTHSF